MFRFGIGVASPSISLSTPAMMRIRVDLPEPFRPSRPILAPGKNDSEISFRIWRLGGTILPTRFMVKTYWAICGFGCLEVCGIRFATGFGRADIGFKSPPGSPWIQYATTRLPQRAGSDDIVLR